MPVRPRVVIVTLVALAAVLAGFALASRAGRTSSGTAAMFHGWESLSGEGIARHVAELASDAYEGREPGTVGEEKALAYLQREFRNAGATPGLVDQGVASFLQPVPLFEIRRTGTPRFEAGRGDAREPYAFRTEFIAAAGGPREGAAIEALPIVFAGHGVTAPEFQWDDYAGARVAGAAVILLRGDPGARDDSTLFRGAALTVHGLGLTQFENAARHGARAAIVVHTEASAGYPWNLVAGSTATAQNFLADAPEVPRLEMVVHVNEAAARRLLAGAGLDFDSLTARSDSRGFAALATPLTASMAYTANVRSIRSHNVIAKLEGSGAKDEAVIYTAHWDHVGRNDSLPGADKIFNGAVDNASGTAVLLELARAFGSLPARPRRTLYFVATTAEEKGLLGSEYLAGHPVVPLAKTVAVLNLDALFPFGKYGAMTVTSLGSSEIEDTLALACSRLGRVLQDDGAPQVGAYYRSDHYPFAKRGVPALFAVGNPRDGEPAPDTVMAQRFADYLSKGYHKVADEYDAKTWDMRGIEGDARAYFETGWRIANSALFPQWRKGNEFRALREAMMRGSSGTRASAAP